LYSPILTKLDNIIIVHKFFPNNVKHLLMIMIISINKRSCRRDQRAAIDILCSTILLYFHLVLVYVSAYVLYPGGNCPGKSNSLRVLHTIWVKKWCLGQLPSVLWEIKYFFFLQKHKYLGSHIFIVQLSNSCMSWMRYLGIRFDKLHDRTKSNVPYAIIL